MGNYWPVVGTNERDRGSPKSAVFILLRPWTSVQNTAHRHSLHISIRLLRPGPRGNPGATWVWDSPPFPSSKHQQQYRFWIVLLTTSFCKITCAGSLEQWRRATRNWVELAFKLLTPRQQPISSTGKPAINLTHTHTHSGKRGMLKTDK